MPVMKKDKGRPAYWVDDDEDGVVIETKKVGKEKAKLKKQKVEGE